MGDSLGRMTLLEIDNSQPMEIGKGAKTADSNQLMKKDAVSRTTYVVVF